MQQEAQRTSSHSWKGYHTTHHSTSFARDIGPGQGAKKHLKFTKGGDSEMKKVHLQQHIKRKSASSLKLRTIQNMTMTFKKTSGIERLNDGLKTRQESINLLKANHTHQPDYGNQ